MKESSQVVMGKAFEYSLLHSLYNRLAPIANVSIIENQPYAMTKKCFESFTEQEQGLYDLNASFAVNFLIDLEPRLAHGVNNEDFLQLEIVADRQGQKGDVRDVLAIRALQKWEIGISAKNNHRAVKHQRLSHKIDFGKVWLGIECSTIYFSEVLPIFNKLAQYKKSSGGLATWKSLGDYSSSVYVPVLNAFRKELLRLDKENPGIVAERLVRYLIGHMDFYKVIKGKNKVEIQAYNIHGTLNMPFNSIKPKFKVPKLKLPTRLIEIAYLENSNNTLIVSLNEGWQISFRIHNASSRIESSLKFDVNLVSVPQSMFTNHLSLG